MKTSKLLLSALVGIMAVGGASALTTEEIKVRCNNSKDTVWDSLNNTCVPRNPCKKDNYAAYCVKDFADVQIWGAGQMNGESMGMWRARKLVEAYARFTDGHEADCAELDTPGLVGQDYVGCIYDNGHYVVFEFDDLSEKLSDGDISLPSKLTELRGSGDYGCYGYPHNESSSPAEYGQWVGKNPILPNNLCYVSHQDRDYREKFCIASSDIGDLSFISSPLELIFEAKYGVHLWGVYSNEVSPDGTDVKCITLGKD